MLQKIDSVTAMGTTGQVSASVLKNMFSNTGNPFLQSDLNASGLLTLQVPVQAALQLCW
ncbi:MAG: hypothetical protein K2X86_11520 [Cytophagaceae bacterium]|nr:hypothetical protein [Cytophagaceae bacterium]